MEKKDFFVSYNKDDKAWAKWIAGTLEESGYTVYLQAWDINHGDDFIEKMNKFLEFSTNYIPVISNYFLSSPYCKKELNTAFNEHLENVIEKFLPVRIENVSLGPIYKTTVYIDLFDVVEGDAKKVLLNGVGLTENPRKKGDFPGKSPFATSNQSQEIKNSRSAFPGIAKNISTTHKYTSMGQTRIRNIIVLEKDNNKKGDLFNRLVCDVFHALGFGEPRYNIQKSGREIDMVLQHRTEKRFAVVESKALNSKVGGTDINKFAGILDVEKGKYESDGNNVIGYFISKSGFTETALLQEEERKQIRTSMNEIILLGPNEIARELVQGNMLCSIENAVNAAQQTSREVLNLCEKVDLIACEQGWIWVLYYSTLPRQAATHFSLVHADGNLLLKSISDTLIEQTKSQSVPFSHLSYLVLEQDVDLHKQAAQDAYFKYLENELGEIQFEGMPTDKDAGAVKVNLENIFVPLNFDYENKNEKNMEYEETKTTIKGLLEKTSKAAILAKPGGGKSTLIRRMALAYAYPERRLKVDDGLPDCNWFPIYIRCRDLGDDATKSVLEIVGTIINRAEITKYSREFEALVENSLQEGQALLLIDGLDEISNENYRVRFVNQLRTFVATYPNIHLIITSRIAGFRAVAGTLASYCEQYSIANLDTDQISLLSIKWHETVLGDSGQPEEESQKVCDIIFNDQRIIVLAENPLLLTTLLFVKRWVGYLPTKKCQLYAEMIKLLLVTWNAVAHDRLDIDETEPQLAYVAYSMTLHGRQTITKDALEKFINDARVSLPELLGYIKISASTFIDQVEERSSLLIQVGLEENERGQLVPSYEFSHLSFQEYLTAKAVAEDWVQSDSSPLDVLKLHINEEHWKEIIPLTAVLLGKHSKEVVRYLVSISNDLVNNINIEEEQQNEKQLVPFHLANCIACEVPMSPELLENAILAVAKCRSIINNTRKRENRVGAREVYGIILKSKYGEIFQETIRKTVFERLYGNYFQEFIVTWTDIKEILNDFSLNLSSILQLLTSKDCEKQVTGAWRMMLFAFEHNPQTPQRDRNISIDTKDTDIIQRIYCSLNELLQTDDELCIYFASWCIAWSGYEEIDILPKAIIPSAAKRLAELWTRNYFSNELKRMISWGLFSICTPDLQKTDLQNIPELTSTIRKKLETQENKFDYQAAINMAVLMECLTEIEIKKLLTDNGLSKFTQIGKNCTKFLEARGYDIKQMKQSKDESIVVE